MLKPEDELRDLIDQNRPEQEYQAFLERHSRFIPREFVQNHGIHGRLVLAKLGMAKDYVSDFFYIAKSSGDTNYVLIELEKPSSRLFKANNDFHSDLYAGLNQIARWRTWFGNTANREAFVNSTLRPLQMYGMIGNPVFIKYVLVIGRRAEVAGNEFRRNLLASQEQHDFKILSYDSLLEDIDGKVPLYVGVRTNETYEIKTTEYLGEALFSLFSHAPERLRITQSLYDDALAHRPDWSELRSLSPKTYMMDVVLPKVQIAA